MLFRQKRCITVEQKFCETQYRTDGCADFVTHVRKEIALCPACTFCGVACRRQLSLHLAKMIGCFLKFSRPRFNDSGSIFDDPFQIRIQILQTAEAFSIFQCCTSDRGQIPCNAEFIRSKQIPHLRVTNDQTGDNPRSYHDRAGHQRAKLRTGCAGSNGVQSFN